MAFHGHLDSRKLGSIYLSITCKVKKLEVSFVEKNKSVTFYFLEGGLGIGTRTFLLSPTVIQRTG